MLSEGILEGPDTAQVGPEHLHAGESSDTQALVLGFYCACTLSQREELRQSGNHQEKIVLWGKHPKIKTEFSKECLACGLG